MATKDINKKLDEMFKTCKKGDLITFEDLAREFDKQPTLVQSRKIFKLSKEGLINLTSKNYQSTSLSLGFQFQLYRLNSFTYHRPPSRTFPHFPSHLSAT